MTKQIGDVIDELVAAIVAKSLVEPNGDWKDLIRTLNDATQIADDMAEAGMDMEIEL